MKKLISKDQARAHIVFDNDGTMIDSLSNFFELAGKILSNHLGVNISDEFLKASYVPDWRQLLINLGASNPSEDLIQAVIDDLNEENKDYLPPLIPGTKEFISELHSFEMATYVWTGRDKASGMKVFNGLGLTGYFLELQFRDTSKAKPDPQGLEEMLAGIAKNKILLIGDSLVDIAGAKAFGIECLIVDWFGHDNHDELMAAGAARVVTSHKDAMDYILSNF